MDHNNESREDFERRFRRAVRERDIVIWGSFALVMVLVIIAYLTLPRCGQGEVLARGAWGMVCVAGHS